MRKALALDKTRTTWTKDPPPSLKKKKKPPPRKEKKSCNDLYTNDI